MKNRIKAALLTSVLVATTLAGIAGGSAASAQAAPNIGCPGHTLLILWCPPVHV